MTDARLDHTRSPDHHWKMAVLVGLFVLIFGGAAFGALLITEHQVNIANQRWCATLELLTATPARQPSDPAANPSRVAAYKLYEDFLVLSKSFGCKDS
jgi:hypothetical protein